ncbi:MAG: C39 family peptidase [Verrucomicrobiota bacterium]
MNKTLLSPSRLKWIPALLLSAFIALIIPATAQSQGLNREFGIPIWKDSNLWDDEAWATGKRLRLQSTKSREGNETYRASFKGRSEVLGQPLYAIDLYPLDGKVNRVIIGFINETDIPTGELANFRAAKAKTRDDIRIRLTRRLKRPVEKKGSMIWSWGQHTLTLKDTSKALILEITKGRYSPTQSAKNKIIDDPKRAAKAIKSYVKSSNNGDVYITQIPKISQGNRGYCVPATWEKYLRHYGLSFNVYDLAEEGNTTIGGSYFTQFTSRMTAMLKPHNYRVQHLRFDPSDLKKLKKQIDSGYPLIWHMNAQFLREWVSRNRFRRDRLPDTPRYTIPTKMAGHALMIIGYNIRNQEIALSDSTELGSSIPMIWIHAEEAQKMHQRSTELLAIIPPNAKGTAGQSGGFQKARWY